MSSPVPRPLALPLALGLRPRRPTAILDAAFDLVRFRFLTVATLALVVQLPLVVLPTVVSTADVLAQRDALVEDALDGSVIAGNFGFGSTSAWAWVAVVGQSIAVALMGVGVTHLLSSWTLGHDPRLGETLGLVARRAPVVLAAWVIALPIKVLGALPCGAGVLFTITWLFVVSPAIGAERVGPWTAIKRSFQLTKRRFGPVLGLVAMTAVVTVVIQLTVNAIVAWITIASAGVGEDPAAWALWVSAAATMLLGLATTTLHASWSALTYVDLRVRNEGMDLLVEAPVRLAVPTPVGERLR